MRGLIKIAAPVLILLLGLTACGVSGGNGEAPELLDLAFINFGYSAFPQEIKAFQISEGGVLREVQRSRFNVAGGPFAVHPSGRFLYNGSYCYFIDASTGLLIRRKEIGPLTETASMFIDPTGRFLFQNTCVIPDSGGEIHGVTVWRIDESTGTLTRAPGGVPPYYYGSFVFDPEGKFAYMIAEGALFAYIIDPDTGSLTDIPGSPYPVGSDRGREPFYSSAVHPGGEFIYLAGDSRISIFAIDAVSGALAEIEGSPVASGLFPMALSVDPLARFVYAASWDQSALFVYSIDPATGSLSEAAGSPYPLPGAPRGLAVAPSGGFVYITIPDLDLIQPFAVNADPGAQTLTARPQLLGGTAPGQIATVKIR